MDARVDLSLVVATERRVMGDSAVPIDALESLLLSMWKRSSDIALR
jgi:hypothetical protein